MTEENAVLEPEAVEIEVIDNELPTKETQPEGEKQGDINDVLAKLDKDPRYKMTDAELDLVEAHTSRDLPEIEESETKEIKPEGEEEEEEEEVKSELKLPELNIDSLMKKTGAKSPEELEMKVDGLKKQLSKRVQDDPQYLETIKKLEDIESKYTKDKQTVESHTGFIQDLQNKMPLAIKHLEQITGLKINGYSESKTGTKEISQDYDDYLDPEMAQRFDSLEKTTSGTIKELKSQIQELVERDKTREERNQKDQEENAKNTTKTQILDEMVEVSSRMNIFQGVKSHRDLINKWQTGKTSEQDAQLINEAFDELFKIGNEYDVDLNTAQDILNGRKSPLLVEQAKAEAKKSTYNRPINKSLSGMQNSQYQHNDGFTRERIEEIIRTRQGATKFPDKWFDDDGNIVKAMIPKHSLDLFGFQ